MSDGSGGTGGGTGGSSGGAPPQPPPPPPGGTTNSGTGTTNSGTTNTSPPPPPPGGTTNSGTTSTGPPPGPPTGPPTGPTSTGPTSTGPTSTGPTSTGPVGALPVNQDPGAPLPPGVPRGSIDLGGGYYFDPSTNNIINAGAVPAPGSSAPAGGDSVPSGEASQLTSDPISGDVVFQAPGSDFGRAAFRSPLTMGVNQPAGESAPPESTWTPPMDTSPTNMTTGLIPQGNGTYYNPEDGQYYDAFGNVVSPSADSNQYPVGATVPPGTEGYQATDTPDDTFYPDRAFVPPGMEGYQPDVPRDAQYPDESRLAHGSQWDTPPRVSVGQPAGPRKPNPEPNPNPNPNPKPNPEPNPNPNPNPKPNPEPNPTRPARPARNAAELYNDALQNLAEKKREFDITQALAQQHELALERQQEAASNVARLGLFKGLQSDPFMYNAASRGYGYGGVSGSVATLLHGPQTTSSQAFVAPTTPVDLSSLEAAAGVTGGGNAPQQAYDSWLGSHPGDTAGAQTAYNQAAMSMMQNNSSADATVAALQRSAGPRGWNAYNYFHEDPAQQAFDLSAANAAGFDSQDVTAQLKRNMPQFTAPGGYGSVQDSGGGAM